MPDIPLSPSLQRLLALVLEADPPMRASAIAERMGLSKDHTTAKLRILRKRGLVAPTSDGSSAVWCALDKARAIREANTEALKRAAACRYQREYKRRQREAEMRAADEWAASSAQCRIVAAGSVPPPVRPAAPVSVFSLAVEAAA